MPITSVSSVHGRLAGYTIGAGLAPGTDVIAVPLPTSANPPLAITLAPAVGLQNVDVNVFYGAGDNTFFAGVAPGSSVTLPRGATADSTTVSRSTDGLTIALGSNNAGTGFTNATTVVVS